MDNIAFPVALIIFTDAEDPLAHNRNRRDLRHAVLSIVHPII